MLSPTFLHLVALLRAIQLQCKAHISAHGSNLLMTLVNGGMIPCRGSLEIQTYIYIYTSSSRASRGRKFQKKKKWCIARKEFAYRMRARRPTSAMPKPFLCCERAFCCSMVLMCRGGDLTSFDVMRSVAG